jgi:hypothetical protein
MGRKRKQKFFNMIGWQKGSREKLGSVLTSCGKHIRLVKNGH